MKSTLKLLFTSIFISGMLPLQAQMVLLNEDFSFGIPANWAVVNEDGLTPATEVSEFVDGWIGYIDGTDTVAASTSYYLDTAGQSMDYLILPKLSLLSYSKLVWSARSVDASFPDNYYVLISTTDSLTGSFTDTLMTVYSENYLWQTHSLLLDTAGYASQDVYIAFRNFTTDGFILELDNIKLLSDNNANISSEAEIDLSLSPNPAADFLTVRHNFSGDVHYDIFSTSGQFISRTSEQIINISNLTSGSYLLLISSDSFRTQRRFVKL